MKRSSALKGLISAPVLATATVTPSLGLDEATRLADLALGVRVGEFHVGILERSATVVVSAGGALDVHLNVPRPLRDQTGWMGQPAQLAPPSSQGYTRGDRECTGGPDVPTAYVLMKDSVIFAMSVRCVVPAPYLIRVFPKTGGIESHPLPGQYDIVALYYLGDYLIVLREDNQPLHIDVSKLS